VKKVRRSILSKLVTYAYGLATSGCQQSPPVLGYFWSLLVITLLFALVYFVKIKITALTGSFPH